MKKSFILVVLIAFTFGASGKDYISITDAMRKKAVDITIRSAGGLSKDNMIIEVTNLTYDSLYVQIDPGIHFKSEDPGMQDLLNMYQLVMDLGNQQMITVSSYGMCTQRSNYGPSSGASYHFNGWADPDLVDLAGVIYETKQFNGLGQMCVWIFSDKIDPSPSMVTTSELEGALKLAEFMNVRAGIDISVTSYDPKDITSSRAVPEIFSVTGVLVYHSPEYQRTNFRIYDDAGAIVHNYYQNRRISPGLHHYKFGVNDIAPKASTYYARITDQEENVLFEMEVDSATVGQDVIPNEVKFPFYYGVKEPLEKVLIRVYLPDGKMVEEIKRYRTLNPGNYTLNIGLLHLFDPAQEFVVKLEDLDGKVYVEQRAGRDVKVASPF